MMNELFCNLPCYEEVTRRDPNEAEAEADKEQNSDSTNEANNEMMFCIVFNQNFVYRVSCFLLQYFTW